MLTMASPNHFSLHSASIAAAATTADARPPFGGDSTEAGVPVAAVAAAATNSAGDVPAGMNAVADADERSTTATRRERVTPRAKDSTLRMLLSSDPPAPLYGAATVLSSASVNSTLSTAQAVNSSESSPSDILQSNGKSKATTATVMSTILDCPTFDIGAAAIRHNAGDQTAPLPLPLLPSNKRSFGSFDENTATPLTHANFTNELPPTEKHRHQSRPADGNSREGAADGLDSRGSRPLLQPTAIMPSYPVSGKLKTSAPGRSMASSSSRNTALADYNSVGELSEFTCANCGKSLSSARSLLRHGSTCKGIMKRSVSTSGKPPKLLMAAAEEAQHRPSHAQFVSSLPLDVNGHYATSDAFEGGGGGDSNHDDSNSSALSKIDDVVDSVVEKLRKQNSAVNPRSSSVLEEGQLDVKHSRNVRPQQQSAVGPLGGPTTGTSQQQLCQLLVTTADGISHAYRVQGMPVYYSTLTTTPTNTTTTSGATLRQQPYAVVTQTQGAPQPQDYDVRMGDVDYVPSTPSTKEKKSSNGGDAAVYRYLCPECKKPYSCRKNVKKHRVSIHQVPLEIAQTGDIERVHVMDEEPKATTQGRVGALAQQTGEQLQGMQNLSSTPKSLRPPPKYVPLSSTPGANKQHGLAPLSPPPGVVHHQTMLRPSTSGTYQRMVRAEHTRLQPHPTQMISTPSNNLAGTANRPSMLSIQQLDSGVAALNGDPFSPPLSMPSCSADLMGQMAGCRYDNPHHTPNTAPATMCYSDFDFWDLEGLKSRIEKPLISRSRDDDLEISSIVEDLKRTEYATSPTTNTTGGNPLQPAFIDCSSSNGLTEGGVTALDYGGHGAEMDFAFGESRSLLNSPPLDDSQRALYNQPGSGYDYYAGDPSQYGSGGSFYQPAAGGNEAVLRSSTHGLHSNGGYTTPAPLVDNVDHYRIEQHGARRVSIGKSDDLIQPVEARHMNGLQGVPPTTSRAGAEKKHSLLVSSHNAGTFPCPSCSRMLSTDYSLRRHMKICERLKEKAEAKKRGKRAAGTGDPKRRRGTRSATAEDEDELPSSEGSLEVIPPDPDSTSARSHANNSSNKKASPPTTGR